MLLFRRTIIKHDVIINFGRKLMMKISFCTTCQLLENVSEIGISVIADYAAIYTYTVQLQILSLHFTTNV